MLYACTLSYPEVARYFLLLRCSASYTLPSSFLLDFSAQTLASRVPQSINATLSLMAAPATLDIAPGVETVIEINKGSSGLGLSIVGGSDTLLGVIIVHEVYEDGAAYQDGRLQSGREN